MKIAIGCDHAAFCFKEQLIKNLKDQGHTVIDCGCYGKSSTHYPIFGRATALCIAKKKADIGVVLCGTGIGISNSANKVKGIRAALVTDIYGAIIAKQKYNVNIIACGARILKISLIIDIVNEFINAKYIGKNDNLIFELDQKILHLNDSENLFNKIIKKWEKGDYTNHKNQPKIELSKK